MAKLAETTTKSPESEGSGGGQRVMRASSNALCQEVKEGVSALCVLRGLLRVRNTETVGCDTQPDCYHAAADGVKSTGRADSEDSASAPIASEHC